MSESINYLSQVYGLRNHNIDSNKIPRYKAPSNALKSSLKIEDKI
jgi:hypothetical protein